MLSRKLRIVTDIVYLKKRYKAVLIIAIAIYTYASIAFLPTLTPPPDIASVRYLINASTTCTSPLLGVLVVTSYAGNHVARDAIRRAYPTDELVNLRLRRVFLLARVDVDLHQPGYTSHVKQEDVDEEAATYGDVVLVDMIEDYRNLTYKNLMGHRWVLEHCQQARYMIKMDDDILMDLYRLVDLIASINSTEQDKILGALDRTQSAVVRDKSDAHYVPYADFPLGNYPVYALGMLYIFTPLTAGLLLAASTTTPYMWKDDIYITGVLAEAAGVERSTIGHLYSRNEKNIMCCHNDEVIYECEKLVGLVSGHGQDGDYSLMQRVMEHARWCHYTKKCVKLSMEVMVECVK